MTTKGPRSSIGRTSVTLTGLLLAMSSCSLVSADPTIPVSLPSSTDPGSTSPTSEVGPGGSTSSLPEGTIRVAPDDDLSSIVENAPEGTTFDLAPGLHRGASAIPKDGMTFRGEPGAVVSGAIVLDDADDLGDGRWRFTGVERTGQYHGECIDDSVACDYTQDLFFDDVMLWQVTSEHNLSSGAWYWGDDGIYVVDDPTSRRVELSNMEFAFRSTADDVTIRSLVVEKYASLAQNGAIQNQQPGDGPHGSGWVIDDVEVRGAHGAGVRTGNDTVVRNLYSHHNGQMGLAVNGGTNVLIEDSELAHNNVAGFNWGWEAGGMKAQRTSGLVVRDTHSHDNDGPGLWSDIDAVDTVYEGNLVERNTGPGIFYEISYDGVIRDNVVLDNGSPFDKWLWGSGILIAASTNVEVVGNEVRGNTNAIGGIQQDRGGGAFGEWILDDLEVYDNVIEVGRGRVGVVEDIGDRGVFDRNIVFDRNTYEGPVGDAYAWVGGSWNRVEWQGYGQDVNSTWR